MITPALDHFYSKAVADLRSDPVVIETPPKDDRYSSLEIFDMEHFAFFDKVTAPEGERFVLAHVDYEGELPEGQEIRTNSIFPFVFIRTQSFEFNDDTKADEIRRQARITGETGPIELPDVNDTRGLIAWTIERSKPYPQTQDLMAEAASIYSPEVHKETFEHVKAFLEKIVSRSERLADRNMNGITIRRAGVVESQVNSLCLEYRKPQTGAVTGDRFALANTAE